MQVKLQLILTLAYIFFQVSGSQHNIERAGGELKAIICDDNLQIKYFSRGTTLFKTNRGKAQVIPTFYTTYFTYGKLYKNIWLMEQAGELMFEVGWTIRTATWKVLRDLHAF